MVQKRVIDCDWARGVGKGGKPRGLSRGDQLFVRPDGVWGGLLKEISPVGGFGLLDGFEIAELGLSCQVVGFGGLDFLGSLGGFREFLL